MENTARKIGCRGRKAAAPLLWWRPTAATFVLTLTRLNVGAVTTILVLHVGVIGHHVPFQYDFMFPRRSYHARGGQGALPLGVWEAASPLMIRRFPIYFTPRL